MRYVEAGARRILQGLLIIGSVLCTGAGLAQDADTPAEALLRSRNGEFSKDLVTVAPGVYTAVGYSPGNASMIVGVDGVVIIDTGQDVAQAAGIVEAFRAISTLPVLGIIYTHGHGDHTGGAAAFIADAVPQIWALENFGSEDRPLAAANLVVQQERGTRQAGFALPDALRINNGIAPAMRPNRQNAFAPGTTAAAGNANAAAPSTAPNRTFAGGRIAIEIAGVKLELVEAPGETSDQLYVWYPEQRVLFAGDNYYKSFPNLYAIRGTPYRDVLAWSNSIDKMLEENAVAVVPGHTRPVLGEAAVATALRKHRDAIRFVHDKTVEGMNMGMTPDELVAYVKLPADLASDPDLGEYYGRVEWAVRSIYTGYLGWYDGNPTHLSPFSIADEAQRIARLAGGSAVLVEQARAALESGDAQWAAQLADYLLALDAGDATAKLIKADAFTVLARNSVNALGRNYYLSVAAQLRSQAAE
jgi:alkyl sulfatase BDS1-like metallo-beta-lactamase superfamily hydrolase